MPLVQGKETRRHVVRVSQEGERDHWCQILLSSQVRGRPRADQRIWQPGWAILVEWSCQCYMSDLREWEVRKWTQ